MGRPIKKGSTDQSTVIRIIDSTDGTPENAVEHDTGGIDLWFRREKEAKTSITEAALAALDSAHADGGIELIGDGYYRLDLPDAAVAAGSGENSVQIGGTVTGMIVIGNEHALVDAESEACSGTFTVETADTVFNLTATSGTLSDQDDAYNLMVICFYDNSGTVYQSKKITDYDGTNTRVTVDSNIEFPGEDGVDTWAIYRAAYCPTSAGDSAATIRDTILGSASGSYVAQGTVGQRIHHSGKGRY